MRAFGFSRDELLLNQRGALSDRQRQVLAGLPRMALYTGLGVCIACLYPTWFLPWLTLHLLTMGVLVLMVSGLVYLRLSIALRDPVISEVGGPLRLVYHSRRGVLRWIETHWLVVDDHRFTVHAKDYKRLVEGGHVQVYYIDLGLAKHVLSATWTM